jgi:hypothetical protein
MTEIEKQRFAPNVSALKPEHLLYRIKAARLQRVEDSYDQGEIGDELFEDQDFDPHAIYKTIPEMFRGVWKNLKGEAPERENIGTIDNTIYCDTKSGETRVVDQRGDRGVHRVIFDRLENDRGGVPSAATRQEWERGERKLYTGRYEIEFEILIAGLDEVDLSNLIGVNHW